MVFGRVPVIACDDAMTAEVVAVTKELIKCSLLVPTGRDAGTQLRSSAGGVNVFIHTSIFGCNHAVFCIATLIVGEGGP